MNIGDEVIYKGIECVITNISFCVWSGSEHAHVPHCTNGTCKGKMEVSRKGHLEDTNCCYSELKLIPKKVHKIEVSIGDIGDIGI